MSVLQRKVEQTLKKRTTLDGETSIRGFLQFTSFYDGDESHFLTQQTRRGMRQLVDDQQLDIYSQFFASFEPLVETIRETRRRVDRLTKSTDEIRLCVEQNRVQIQPVYSHIDEVNREKSEKEEQLEVVERFVNEF